tara:strand:- start:191 stop:1375 length:1185 start_codon:yes stop_codon:yes gene_type:complete
MRRATIAIAGGSIGGLTAGCLLRDAGHDVTIFERSSRELEQRGAGIGFLEAASRYLVERAGIDIESISVRTPFIRYLNRDNTIRSERRHNYRFSSWNTVYRHMLAAFDNTRYCLGEELTGWTTSDDGVVAQFAGGASFPADLLVCADGVGSSSRTSLLPEVRPQYAGYVAWRGMVPESEFPPELTVRLTQAITYYVYANSHILVYPIPALDGSVEQGRRLINFVWYRNYLDGSDLDDLLTDSVGERRDISVPPGAMSAHHQDEARAVARARLPSDLATVVVRAADLFVQVVYDVVVERMVFDRVCLLGDAAFVARPHAAAGTAKAAEDGWALARALQDAPSVDSALAFWEQQQLLLGDSLVRRAQEIGRRSQVDNSWEPGDPAFLFGLHRAGDL